MAAPKGNRYWEKREVHGAKKLYTPGTLWEKACEYFEWCDNNPWIKKDFVRGGDMAGTIIDLPTQRPYTISGFCVFAGIDVKTFENYSKAEGYEDFFPVCIHIREIIATQKFEGAAVGAFNSNLIIRDLGMVDKQDQNVKAAIDHNHKITGMEIL